MRIFIILVFLFSFLNCSNNSKEQQLLKELHKAKKDISFLEDSIAKMNLKFLFKDQFGFNSYEPKVLSKDTYFENNKSLTFEVCHLAKDTSSWLDLMFWIDDSTMSFENNFAFRGPKGSGVITLDSKIKRHQVALTKGKHTIYGKVASEINNIKRWKPFKFSYEIK